MVQLLTRLNSYTGGFHECIYILYLYYNTIVYVHITYIRMQSVHHAAMAFETLCWNKFSTACTTTYFSVCGESRTKTKSLSKTKILTQILCMRGKKKKNSETDWSRWREDRWSFLATFFFYFLRERNNFAIRLRRHGMIIVPAGIGAPITAKTPTNVYT